MSNQRIALDSARLLARLLNRTLIVPDLLAPHDGGDLVPTRTCAAFDGAGTG